MNYIGIIISLISLVAIIFPEKAKKIVYNIIYLLPFWFWGLLILVSASLVWYLRVFSPSFWFVFISLFGTGSAALLLPKRRMKKRVEFFLELNNQDTRLIFIIPLLFGLAIVLI